MQSMLARNNLLSILVKSKLMETPASEYLSDMPGDLEVAFRTGWVYHGNLLSSLYAGTPALKTDFTLLRKRTVKGVLADGKNGATR